MNIENLAPHNNDTEKAVLSCILQDPWVLYESDLSDKFFYSSIHRLILLAMLQLRDDHKTIDVVTLSKKIGSEHQEYLLEVMMFVLWSSGFNDYVSDLKDLYYRRELLKHSSLLAGNANNEHTSVESIVSTSHAFFNDLMIDNKQEETVQQAINEIIRKAWTQEMVIGNWWYEKFDSLVGGIRWWQLSVVAGRPWQWKSTIAINAISNLMDQWIKSVLISLEMRKQQIMRRLFDLRYNVNKFHFDKKDSKFIMEYLGENWHMPDVLEIPNYIDIKCPNRLDINIYNSIYKWYYQDWVKIFFVDYLGLISTVKDRWSVVYNIWSITQKLKEISLELDVHICILVQLSREIEKRTNKYPQLSDLRDSWSIEQDADYIVWLTTEQDENNITQSIGLHVIKNRDWVGWVIHYKQKRLKIYNEEVNT